MKHERRIGNLERTPPTPGDSGWYIGEVEGARTKKNVSDLEAIRVCDLLEKRPTLMEVLALPPGYLVVVSGLTIEAVLNPENRTWGRAVDPHALLRLTDTREGADRGVQK
jgi:hypothetical protein